LTNLALRRDKTRNRRLKKAAASTRNRKEDPKKLMNVYFIEGKPVRADEVE